MKQTVVITLIVAIIAQSGAQQCGDYNLYTGGYDLLGLYDLYTAGVNPGDTGACCAACTNYAGCNTWVLRTTTGQCFLKNTPNCVAPAHSAESDLTAGQLSVINGAQCAAAPTPNPSPAPQPPSAVCGNGVVEGSEQCDGGACCTSTCTFATSVCRASAGPCDVAETCSGSSASCPADSVAPSSQVCRPSAGSCDVAETCSGSSVSCPADTFASNTTVCRAAVNSCDIAEKCTGSSVTCPADVVSETAACFCARQSLADGQMAYYCDATGGFYQCLGGVFASQSRDMACARGTTCGCAFGVECSCDLSKSPCVFTGQSQSC
jgi:hypothetical protein